MKWVFGDPLAALSLFLAAVTIGASFQAPILMPLSYVGLVIVAAMIEIGYSKLIPAFVAGFAFQLLGVEWMRHCYSTLQLTEARLQNWILLGLAFSAVLPVVLVVGVWLRGRGWPLWVVLPVAWTIGDALRYEGGRLISGGPYPWLTLGLSQTDFPVGCQVADVGGVWAVGFLAAMFAATVVQSVVERRVPARPLLILSAAIIYGWWRMSSTALVAGPTVALMPGQTLEVPAADFALWPETALGNCEPLPARAVLFQGTVRHDGDEMFNSVAIVGDGRVLNWYDKCNLVPWSEYLPWGGRGRQFTAGDKPGVFDCGQFRVGVAVCYDACFGEFIRAVAEKNPQFIVIPANESSDPSMMMAQQLLAQTRLRAIEARRAIVRNANGGFSGVVDGCGRFSAAPIDFREPVIVGPVPLDERFSLYTWTGGWLPVACALAVLLSIRRGPRLQRVPRGGGDVVENEAHRAVAK